MAAGRSPTGPYPQTRLWFLAIVLSLTTAPGAAVASGFQQFAGWEGDSRGEGYGFAAAALPLPLSRHLSIPLSASGSFLYYDYDSSAAHVIVRSPGTSLMTGLRLAGSRGSASVQGGGEIRWDRRLVDGPGGWVAMRQVVGPVVQTYDDLGLGRRWYASGFGVYVGAAKYLIGRVAIRDQITNLDWKRGTSFFLGAEGGRQGNEHSDALQGGGFAEWNLVARRMSLALHAGYKESWSPGYAHQRGSYFAFSFGRF